MESGVTRRPTSGDCAERAPLVRLADITKTFPGLRALDAVSLDVGRGEIVAVVGQNGSGKSTLVKILAGVYTADSGRVELLTREGRPVTGPAALQRLHFIHQDLGLIATLSTIENLDLSRRLGAGTLAPPADPFRAAGGRGPDRALRGPVRCHGSGCRVDPGRAADRRHRPGADGLEAPR